MSAQAVQETAKNEQVNDGKITSRVLAQVRDLQSTGRMNLPPDYDVANALQSAWLKLQTVENKDHKPVIKNGQVDTSVVTMVSVANALFDYVVQGLNVAKNQAYFIVYDNALTMQRSYFGDMHVAQMVRPGIGFYYDVIRAGDDFKTEKIWSKQAGLIETVAVHAKPWSPNVERDILGAYCGVVDTETGENLGMVLFDMDRIKKSWGMSKTYKWSNKDKPSTHDKFTDEMSLRTVIRRRCKEIINASNDSTLLAAIRRQDEDTIDADFAEEVAANANKQTLSLEGGQVIEMPQVPPQQTETKSDVAKEEAPAEDSQPAKQKKSEPADEEMDF